MGSGGSSEDHLGTGLEGHLRVDSGSILGQFGSILGPYLRNLIKYTRIAFIWPWVVALRLNMTKYGSWEVAG